MALTSMMVLLSVPRFVLGKLAIPAVEIAPGVSMPTISIGTGGTIDPTRPEDASIMVANWLEQGAVGIDTACNYKNQDLISKTIANSTVKREDLFITSKVNGCESADKTSGEIEATLQQLNTTYVDLMLVHWRILGIPSRWFPSFLKPSCAATWSVLEEYQKKGVLRAIGVSNFADGDLRDLAKTARMTPAVNQVEWNVFYHNDATAEYCKEHNITIEAYAPFTDEYNVFNRRSVSKDPTVMRIAAKHNVSAFQVAGRWVVQAGHVVTFGSSKKSHQANSADIFGWSLADDDMQALNAVQHSHASLVV